MKWAFVCDSAGLEHNNIIIVRLACFNSSMGLLRSAYNLVFTYAKLRFWLAPCTLRSGSWAMQKQCRFGAVSHLDSARTMSVGTLKHEVGEFGLCNSSSLEHSRISVVHDSCRRARSRFHTLITHVSSVTQLWLGCCDLKHWSRNRCRHQFDCTSNVLPQFPKEESAVFLSTRAIDMDNSAMSSQVQGTRAGRGTQAGQC